LIEVSLSDILQSFQNYPELKGSLSVIFFLPERYLYPLMQIPSHMETVSWCSHNAWILKVVFLIWLILS